MRILFAASLAAAILSGAVVLAQENPITARQEIMKKSDEDVKLMTKMSKGEVPYDGAKVTAAYAAIEGGYKKVQNLFPDNSKTGDNTRASPKVWENRADFDTKLAALIKVAGEAKAKAATEEGFKAVHADVVKACDNCHSDYRIRRQR